MKRTSILPSEMPVLRDALELKTRHIATTPQAGSKANSKDKDLRDVVEANINAHQMVRPGKGFDDDKAGISLGRRQKRRAVKALDWVLSHHDIVEAQLLAERDVNHQQRVETLVDASHHFAGLLAALGPRDILPSPADSDIHEQVTDTMSNAGGLYRKLRGDAVVQVRSTVDTLPSPIGLSATLPTETASALTFVQSATSLPSSRN